MLDDLTTRDQRMMFAVVTLVHLADSKEELDSDTETLQSIARKHLCQLTTLNWQQADGLVTALPLGLRRIGALRTLTTEALAVLMPFKAQEIWDRGGVYYGQNAISKNLIVADRKAASQRQRIHSGRLRLRQILQRQEGDGVSGACPRRTISSSSTRNRSTAPHRRAGRPGHQHLRHLSQPHQRHGYGAGLWGRREPRGAEIRVPALLCEQLIGAGKLSAKEKSVIDRCTAQVYRDYIRSGYHGAVPTLQDFHAELLRQPRKGSAGCGAGH